MRSRIVLFIATLIVGIASTAFGQQNRAIVVDPVVSGLGHGKKIALVVGNAVYQSQPVLFNPGNDAQKIAEVLKNSGFDLVGGKALTNLSFKDFAEAVKTFGISSEGADVAAFYYSGHGVQLNGKNYLVPIDAKFSRPVDVPLQNLDLDAVFGQLDAKGGPNLKILMLDACRNNPFAGPGKGLARVGLAPIDVTQTTGTVISFATAPDQLASDGLPGGNSPYALALANEMKMPGSSLWEMFNQVGLDVLSATQKDDPPQQPWFVASPIQGTFYFAPPKIPVQMVVDATPVRIPSNLLQPAVFTQVAINEPIIRLPPTVSNGSAIFYTGQAWQLMADDRFEEAHAPLATARRADPASAIPDTFDGFAYYWQGVKMIRQLYKNPAALQAKWDSSVRPTLVKAENALDQAVRLDPVYQYPRRHLGEEVLVAYWARKVLGLNLGNLPNDAAKQFEDALKIDPTDRRSIYDLGVAYTLAGRHQEAVVVFNRLITLSPSYLLAYSGRCAAYTMMGRFDVAGADASYAASHAQEFKDRACLNIARTGDIEFFFRYD